MDGQLHEFGKDILSLFTLLCCVFWEQRSQMEDNNVRSIIQTCDNLIISGMFGWTSHSGNRHCFVRHWSPFVPFAHQSNLWSSGSQERLLNWSIGPSVSDSHGSSQRKSPTQASIRTSQNLRHTCVEASTPMDTSLLFLSLKVQFFRVSGKTILHF